MPQNTKLLSAVYLRKQQEVVDRIKQMEIEFEHRFPLEQIALLANAQVLLNNNTVIGVSLSNAIYAALHDYLTIALGFTITNVNPQQQTTTFDMNW